MSLDAWTPVHNFRSHADYYGRVGGNDDHELTGSQIYPVIPFPRAIDSHEDQAQLFPHQDWISPPGHEVEYKHFHHFYSE